MHSLIVSQPQLIIYIFPLHTFRESDNINCSRHPATYTYIHTRRCSLIQLGLNACIPMALRAIHHFWTAEALWWRRARIVTYDRGGYIHTRERDARVIVCWIFCCKGLYMHTRANILFAFFIAEALGVRHWVLWVAMNIDSHDRKELTWNCTIVI